MITFTFTINPQTQEAVFVGNIEPQVALGILQQIVISEAVRKSRNTSKEERNDGTGRAVEKARVTTSQDKT